MTRRYRFFLILLAAALACAGLPAHACPGDAEVGADGAAQTTMAASGTKSRCPFHAATAEEQTDQDNALSPADSSADGETGCCLSDCGCGCSAPVPGVVIALAGEASPHHDAIRAAPTRFDPSLPPERLLRPPQAQA